MKAKNLIQPGIRAMESVSADDVSPHSSAMRGVTLLGGDLQDVLAVLRTAVLLARNLKASLSLSLPGKEVLPVDLVKLHAPRRQNFGFRKRATG